MNHLNTYLNYLKASYPLKNVALEVIYHNDTHVPAEITIGINGQRVVGSAHYNRKAGKVVLHIGAKRSKYDTLKTLAHEYRHAVQNDTQWCVGQKGKRELDAYKFELSETKKYCRANGITIK